MTDAQQLERRERMQAEAVKFLSLARRLHKLSWEYLRMGNRDEFRRTRADARFYISRARMRIE